MPSICFQTLLYSYNVEHKTHINKEESSLGDLILNFPDEFPYKGWDKFISTHHQRSAYHCASWIYEGGPPSFHIYSMIRQSTSILS